MCISEVEDSPRDFGRRRPRTSGCCFSAMENKGGGGSHRRGRGKRCGVLEDDGVACMGGESTLGSCVKAAMSRREAAASLM